MNTDAFGRLDAPIPISKTPSVAVPPPGALDAWIPVPLPAAEKVLVLELRPPLGELRFKLVAPTVTIGRHDAREGISPDLDLGPYEPAELRSISRRHAEILRTEDGYRLLDLGSANGTWINEVRIAAGVPTPIQAGDVLRLGRVGLYVVAGS